MVRLSSSKFRPETRAGCRRVGNGHSDVFTPGACKIDVSLSVGTAEVGRPTI